MAADPSLEAFLATLRRSRLFDAPELDRLAAKARPESARAFADALIRNHELTHYQADKLLGGRWQGLVIGPYCVLAPLGRGGMGTGVYLARDRRAAESLGDTELLALKLLPHKMVTDPKVLTRFRREMELGRRANHPNVVRTFAAGDQDEIHYLALEFVPGKTLRQLVSQKGPLDVGDAARIFADVAAGLEHLHERGLIHRDVKPANVMVRPDGRAVLLDLGLAFAPADPLPADPTIVGGRGYVVGTMDYLAPEQAKDSTRVVPATDLYGLGCSLVYALTGSAPFPAEGTKQKLLRHRSDPPPDIPDVPVEFVRIIYRLMAKSPEERPASAARVRELLLPWATAARALTHVDALTAADAPGLDSGLWDAAPGDELPPIVSEPEANPFAQLEEDSGSAVVKRKRDPKPIRKAKGPVPDSNRLGWVLVALLTGVLGLVVLITALRRL
jgi:serine/threonine protein kinase